MKKTWRDWDMFTDGFFVGALVGMLLMGLMVYVTIL